MFDLDRKRVSSMSQLKQVVCMNGCLTPFAGTSLPTIACFAGNVIRTHKLQIRIEITSNAKNCKLEARSTLN